jgi:prepilin-type N-terminal cleavage/methylation domain-containing protein
MTLTELMVVLALLGALAAVVAQAARQPVRRRLDLASRIDSLRQQAFLMGRRQGAYLRDSTRFGEILVLPTGAVVAESTLRIGPLTGDLRP